MTSAFYLFALPECWKRFLAFNLNVDGREIGKIPGRSYSLACGVLPMGWGSAVAVMQEISEALLERGGLPDEQRVQRTRPVPEWLTQVLEKAEVGKRAWFHVYLDNFFAGERCAVEEELGQAEHPS